MSNYYELLGINQGASEDEIRTKLKEKKRLWTQRQNAPKPEQQQEATNNLRLVPEIESTLLSHDNRATYDKKLQSAPKEEAHVDVDKIKSEDLVKQGWQLHSVGKAHDALFLAIKATGVQGDNPDAWALLGYSKAQVGEIDDAIYEYKRAINLRPNDATFYFELGGIYENIENWDDALRQFKQATQIDQNTPVYFAGIGNAYIRKGLFQDGIAILKDCVQKEPDNKSFKSLLTAGYIDSAIQENWTYIPEGTESNVVPGLYYATEKSHIEHAENAIAQAEQLNIDEFSKEIENVKKEIEKQKKRMFLVDWPVTGIWAVIGLITINGIGIIFLAIAGFHIYASRPTQYKIFNELIANKDPARRLPLVWAVLLYPVSTTRNFIKNFVAD